MYGLVPSPRGQVKGVARGGIPPQSRVTYVAISLRGRSLLVALFLLIIIVISRATYTKRFFVGRRSSGVLPHAT